MAALRLPQHLADTAHVDSGEAHLKFDLLEEPDASVGQTERQVANAIAALRAYDAAGAGDPRTRRLLLEVAVEAVWRLVVQHEANDLTDHTNLIERFAIPSEVLARVGSL